MFAVKLAVLKFLVKMSSVCFSSAFKKIKNFEKHSNLSKYDSKILTLSRSKSKGSLSKLKINKLKSNS